MSFDVFLQRFAGGECGEVNRERVLAVLRTTKFTGPDAFGFYIVEFPDGRDVEFSAKGLEDFHGFTNCAFHIRGGSPHLTKFIFEIARAGDMVIVAAMEPFMPILSSPEQLKELPVELAQNDPQPVVCNSPEELELLLSGGYADWQKYRDQILRRVQGHDTQSP